MTLTPGLCGCGCGGETRIAPRTQTRCGWVKGQPQPFLRGHTSWNDLGPRWIEGPVPVDRPDLGPCWIWQRAINPQGYPLGSFTRYGAGKGLAHRALFEINVGPIPDGMEIDHLCFTPSCVRWEAAPGAPSGHLEIVTPAENLRRRRTTNQKLYNPDLIHALVLRGTGLSWRAIAEELGCTHPPLLNRLYKFCDVNGIPFPKSESTRPAHLKPAKRPPARGCLSCIGFCQWRDDAWVCGKCGSTFTSEHDPKFAPPEQVALI